MKIILTQMGHPNFRGGGNIVANKLCEEFSKMGHSVTGIFLAPKNLVKESVKVNYKIILGRGFMVPFVNVFQGWRILRNIIKTEKPDVVISLGYEGLVVPFIKKKALFIAASHSPFLRYFGIKNLIFSRKLLYPPSWGKWLFETSFFLDRITKINADAVQAVCEFGADQCEKIYKVPAEKIFIVSNGINAGKFSLREFPSEKVILFIGGTVEYKGLDILLEAAGFIFRKYSDFKIIIIGEEDKRKEKLVKLAQKLGIDSKLEWKGLVYPADIPTYFRKTSILAIPSRLELFGIVALESMASGVPIVASNAGGLPEVVINGENGLIVERENPQKLAEAIMYLFDNPIEAEEMGKKGRKRVEENFTWEKVVEKFEEEIDKRMNKGI
jgi:glycosyltransferase involved in cell wall biosynthesis